MKCIIISGRSGSGKSTALQILEDLSFYCVDNLPLSLLPNLAETIQSQNNDTQKKNIQNIAVGIDARNLTVQLEQFNTLVTRLRAINIECEVVYIDASDETLLNRFHASRRKHPLSNDNTSLLEAISKEEALLKPLENLASLTIDTSFLTIHQLSDQIKQYIYHDDSQQIAILIQSFSYKHGLPHDADLVFDVRCLINPHWQPELKNLNGKDLPVKKFLAQDDYCQDMVQEISSYLMKWIPLFEKNNRSYLSIAIGCTGGQHRSVFTSEAIFEHLQSHFRKVQIRHRELNH